MRDPQHDRPRGGGGRSASDIGLSYKLLRMVNSAARGGRGIESIRHAVQLTGRDGAEQMARAVARVVDRCARRRRIASCCTSPCSAGGCASCSPGRRPAIVTRARCFSSGCSRCSTRYPACRCASCSRRSRWRRRSRRARGRDGTVRGAAHARRGVRARRVGHRSREHASSSGLDAAQVGAFYVQSLAWTRDRLLSLAGA